MSALLSNQTKTVHDLCGHLRLAPAEFVDERGCLMRSKVLGAHAELSSITDAELLDFIWNNQDGGNAIVSCEGIIIAVNKRFAEWLRMPAHELEGMHFDQITVASDIDADSKALAEVLLGLRDEYTMNKQYTPRDEAPFTAKLHVIPFMCKDPKIGKVAFLHSQVEKVDKNGMPVAELPDIVYVDRWVRNNWKVVLAIAFLCAVTGSVIFETLASFFPALQPAADALNGGTP